MTLAPTAPWTDHDERGLWSGPILAVKAPTNLFYASANAVKLYIIIANYHADGFNPTRRELAEHMEFGKVSTVDRYIKELADRGLMTVDGGGGRRVNKYHLLGSEPRTRVR